MSADPRHGPGQAAARAVTVGPRTLEACVAHALGRPGYVARWTASTVRAQWTALPPDSRTRVLRMIRAAIASRPAGRVRDADGWADLMAWGGEHLDDPVSGAPELDGGLIPAAVRAVLAGRAREQAGRVWADLNAAWPRLMTATRQVVLTDLADHDDPRLAVYAPTDPRAARLAAGVLARTGRAQRARDLLTLATSAPTARTGTGVVRRAHCNGL